MISGNIQTKSDARPCRVTCAPGSVIATEDSLLYQKSNYVSGSHLFLVFPRSERVTARIFGKTGGGVPDFADFRILFPYTGDRLVADDENCFCAAHIVLLPVMTVVDGTTYFRQYVHLPL